MSDQKKPKPPAKAEPLYEAMFSEQPNPKVVLSAAPPPKPKPKLFVLASDNPAFPPEVLTGSRAASLDIMGKVMWWGHTNRE